MVAHPYGEQMIQPESTPVHDASHAHVDMDDLMDASSKGPGVDEPDGEVDTGRAVGGDGEEADVTGESSDAYMSGQDGGSID